MATNDKTISQVFDEFLADQKASLSPNTFAECQTIIDLFEDYLESYCPGTSQIGLRSSGIPVLVVGVDVRYSNGEARFVARHRMKPHLLRRGNKTI